MGWVFSPFLNCLRVRKAECRCVESEFQTAGAVTWKPVDWAESWSMEPACHVAQPNGSVADQTFSRPAHGCVWSRPGSCPVLPCSPYTRLYVCMWLIAVTYYTLDSVLLAFGLTCIVVCALTAYAIKSERDFSAWSAGYVCLAGCVIIINPISVCPPPRYRHESYYFSGWARCLSIHKSVCLSWCLKTADIVRRDIRIVYNH